MNKSSVFIAYKQYFREYALSDINSEVISYLLFHRRALGSA